jgi:hypothetical protein
MKLIRAAESIGSPLDWNRIKTSLRDTKDTQLTSWG